MNVEAILLCVLLDGGTDHARVQSDTGAPRSRWPRPANISGFAALATNSAFSTRSGTLRRDFFLAGIRSAWTLSRNRHATWRYIVDVIPLAVITNNPNRYEVEPCGAPRGAPPTLSQCIVARTGTIAGAGVGPAGLQIEVTPERRLSLSANAVGGVIAFTRPLQDPELRRLNLTFSAGGALGVNITSQLRASIGYAWHHTSNAGTAQPNPGMNSHMLVLGLARARDQSLHQ